MRLLLLSAAGLALAVGSFHPARSQDDPVVATVNGSQVHRSELEAAQKRLPEQYRDVPLQMIYDPLLERVIDGRLLAGEAEKRGIENEPAVKEEIERATDDVLRDQLIDRTVSAAATPERLQAAYDAMKSQPGFASEEVHARHILVADEATARQVLAELAKGADFAAVAKERSTDPSAKENAGDLGYFKRDAMVPEFSEAAFKIEPGTVGKEPVKSQFGWHVIKVEDRRTAVPTLEEKEPELREQIARAAVDGLLTSVRGDAKIERMALDGSPLPPDAAGAAPQAPTQP